MTDILFGNNNRPVLKLLAKRSLKAQKNTIAVLAIMLATLLFTSLFTIAISLQTAMQESNMRTTGTSAHAGIKRLSWEEYEKLSSDTGIKDIGYSIIIGNAVGDDFNKTPTELRYGDETYSELTFITPDTGHLPEQKNEIATSRIVLDAMGLPDKVGTQMKVTFTTDTDTFTDTFTLCGIWDGDAVAYRQTMLLSKAYTEQVAPVIHGETDGTTPPVGTGYIDAVMMMPTAWNIEKQALDVTSEYGLDERVSINDASRIRIYLANLIVCAIASVLISLSYTVGVFVIGNMNGGELITETATIFLCMISSLMISITFASIMTLLAILNTNKAGNVVVSMILALVLLVSGSFIHQKLGEPKLYDNYVTVNEMGIPTQVEQLPNPQYIEGTPRIVLEVLSDLLPSGQAIQLADAFDTEGMTDESIAKAPYRWMGYSLLVTFLTSVLGIALFQKKEIR